MSPEPGIVVWLTGLPSSGKSTLARQVAAQLTARKTPCVVLDGDEVRAALRPVPGYDDAARDAFYDTLARLAALAAEQGLTALVPATASRRAYRERARSLAPRFIETFVDTPLELCMQRDSKGLYAKATSGALTSLPGVTASFEAPERADVVVRPETEEPVSRVIEALDRLRG